MLEANPEAGRGVEGSMLLHLVAGWGSERLTRLLLERGAEVNTRGMRGLTALDRAVRLGAKAELVVKLLRANGAAMTSRAAVALGDADWLRARQSGGRRWKPRCTGPRTGC